MWAGGKNKMIPKYIVSPGIPTGYDTYVEPFFGGGAMMIHMFNTNPEIKRFVLNDINPEIVGLYTAIKTNIDDFLKHLDVLCGEYLPKDKADRKVYYYQIRDQYTKYYHDWSKVKESATLYFLMKTSFNGIFQSTKAAKGRFATPCGLLNQTTQVYDRDNVIEWHNFLQKVDIYSGDWKECVIKNNKEKTFFFMDPPYRDSFTQYGQNFTDEHQIEVIDFCKKADKEGHLVYFCNRDANDTFYDDHREDLEIEYYDVSYTAGRRATDESGNKTAKSAREILLYSKAIKDDSLFY